MPDLHARLFSATPLGAELSAEEEKFLRSSMRQVRYRENKLLVAGDSLCDEVLILQQGAMRVFKVSEEGREVTLYRLSAGDTCLMTVSCLAGAAGLDANVEIEAGTEVISIPGLVFQSLLENNPALHRYMMQKAFLRLNQVMRVVELVTFASSRARIALYLQEAKLRQGKPRLKLTQEQIALEVGTAREVVSRVLGEFADVGVVALSRGTIELIDENLLEDMAVQ